jgi:RHS repeat-associated protein
VEKSKCRDTESQLDYFGARYHSFNLGRFMAPDTSDGPDPVPFADLENPQSLNLYSYVTNNPLSEVDDDGHDGASPTASCSGFICWIRHLWKGGGDENGPAPPPAPTPPGAPEGAPGRRARTHIVQWLRPSCTSFRPTSQLDSKPGDSQLFPGALRPPCLISTMFGLTSLV